MNSVFTFDHFRFASYLRIAFISYEYGFVAVVWPSSVSESCQNFCLRFEWVTSRPQCRPQLTRTNYNLPFFFYRNDCLIPHSHQLNMFNWNRFRKMKTFKEKLQLGLLCRIEGPLKYLLMPLLGKNQLAITLHMYASIGPNLDNTHRGQI